MTSFIYGSEILGCTDNPYMERVSTMRMRQFYNNRKLIGQILDRLTVLVFRL